MLIMHENPSCQVLDFNIPMSLLVAIHSLATVSRASGDSALQRLLTAAVRCQTKRPADWKPFPLAMNLSELCSCWRCEDVPFDPFSNDRRELVHTSVHHSSTHDLSRSHSAPEAMHRDYTDLAEGIPAVGKMSLGASNPGLARHEPNEEVPFPDEIEIGRADPSSESRNERDCIEIDLDEDAHFQDQDIAAGQTKSSDPGEGPSNEDKDADDAPRRWKGKGREIFLEDFDYEAAYAESLQTKGKGKGRERPDDLSQESSLSEPVRKRFVSQSEVIFTETDPEVADAGSIQEAWKRRGGVILDDEGPLERHARLLRESNQNASTDLEEDEEEYEYDDDPIFYIPDVGTNDLFTEEKAREWELTHRRKYSDLRRSDQGWQDLHEQAWEDLPYGPRDDVDMAALEEEWEEYDAEAWNRAANIEAVELPVDGLGPSVNAFERAVVMDDESQMSTPTQSAVDQAASFGSCLSTRASTPVAGRRGSSGLQEQQERFSTTAMVREIEAIHEQGEQQVDSRHEEPSEDQAATVHAMEEQADKDRSNEDQAGDEDLV